MTDTASGPPTPPPAVETIGLTKRYGEKVAVDNLNLRIAKGEVFGLLGPNGAGKTTTILMLLGLSEPSAGEARVDGLDPTRDAIEVKRRVGYLPDSVGFYENMSARQNLEYTADLNRIARSVRTASISDTLAAVGLSDAADRMVGGYSRGMKQRLGVADALLKSPSIMILDEPTVNIDPEGVNELLALVRSLADDRDVTVLLSSHLLHQVQAVCDRIGIFVAGRLVANGSIDELARALDDRIVIEVGVEGSGTELRSILASMPGITSVTSADDGNFLVAADADIRTELAAAIFAAGLQLQTLARRSAELDAIYGRYFDTAAAADEKSEAS